MMNKRQVETKHLYWGPIASADYLWGSTIQKLAKDRILFKNPLMPSGQIVKKWQSITRYDGDRMAPSLPLLKRGKAYRLDVSMSSKPAHTVLVEIVFQDRFGVTVERKVTSDGSLSTKYACLVRGCKNLHLTISLFHPFRLRRQGFPFR